MKIVKLSIENLKKIKAIDISPDSNTVLITGRNEQDNVILYRSKK